MSLIVIRRPLRTRFMIASTSDGAGTTKVPVPHDRRIVSLIFPTLGRSLGSASFSRQDLRLGIAGTGFRNPGPPPDLYPASNTVHDSILDNEVNYQLIEGYAVFRYLTDMIHWDDLDRRGRACIGLRWTFPI